MKISTFHQRNSFNSSKLLKFNLAIFNNFMKILINLKNLKLMAIQKEILKKNGSNLGKMISRLFGMRLRLFNPLHYFFEDLLKKERNVFARILFFPLRLTILMVFSLLKLMQIVFVPHVIVRQLLALIFFQGLYEFSGFMWQTFRWSMWTKDNKYGQAAAECRNKMENASSYEEWKVANSDLGKIFQTSGNFMTPEEKITVSKLNSKIESYEMILDLVRNSADKLQEYNIMSLQSHLRNDLIRKHSGISDRNPIIKETVRKYHSLVLQALKLVALYKRDYKDAVEEMLAVREKIRFFEEIKQSFGNSALLLSGGARLGLLHVGVIKTLLTQSLLPKVISGSSAGALVVAMVGSKTDDEIQQLFNPENLNLRFFGREDSIGAELDKVMQQPQVKPKLLETTDALKKAQLRRLDSTNRFVITLLPQPFQQYFSLFRKLLPKYIDSKTLLDVDILKNSLRDVIGDITFLEAYQRTGRIINITVTPQNSAENAGSMDSDFPQLLNYLTAPDVVIWSAAVASCSIPGVFAPVVLYKRNTLKKPTEAHAHALDKRKPGFNVERLKENVNGDANETAQKIIAESSHNGIKDGPKAVGDCECDESDEFTPCAVGGMKWTDGSLEMDLPINRMKEMFDVNHFIVSQVNPHARILAPHIWLDFYGFMPSYMAYISENAWNNLGGLVMFLRDQIRSWLKHLADYSFKSSFLRTFGIGAMPLLTQKYHGDITIQPKVTLQDLGNLLRNPTEEEYAEAIMKGERMTWPLVSKIKRRCVIEFMLNDCLLALKNRENKLEKLIVHKYRLRQKVGFSTEEQKSEPLSPEASNMFSRNKKQSEFTLQKLERQLENRVVSVLNLAEIDKFARSERVKNENKMLDSIKEAETEDEASVGENEVKRIDADMENESLANHSTTSDEEPIMF